MKTVAFRASTLAAACLLLLAVPALGSVNKSVTIGDGETADEAKSVNGSVTVGDDAVVNGELSTVNGAISIGDRAAVQDAHTVNGRISIGSGVSSADLETVNGSIKVDKDGRIDGSVTAVNGSIGVAGGSRVRDDLSNVNGNIELDASEVAGSMSTVNGDVELSAGAVVKGDITVEKPNSWGFSNNDRLPTVTIGPDCRVDGIIRLEREVKLYISESASVGGVEGVMSLSDAVRYSGERP